MAATKNKTWYNEKVFQQITNVFPASNGFHASLLAFRILLSTELITAHGLKKVGVGVAEAEKVPNPLHLPEAFNNLFADAANLVFPVFVIVGLFTRLTILPILAVTLTGYFVLHFHDTPYRYSLSYFLFLVLDPGKYSLDYYSTHHTRSYYHQKSLVMRKRFLFAVFLLGSANVFSQKLPAFKPLRYDEDYSFLKNDSAIDLYAKIKFVPLSASKETNISYGGEMRYQYFYVKNETWGDDPNDDDGYVLTRWLAHADLHAGKYFRTFVQLQSSLANSRIGASPVENNPLELHQAFIDINSLVSEKSKLTFRIGRQELLYGSQRIVAVRDGPNNRQSFDALRSIFTSGNYRADVFFSHNVAAKSNIFNDGFNKNAELWGAYLVKNKVPVIKNIDLYYLGLWKKNTTFNIGSGKELRHSIGTRIWSSKNVWKYDVEVLYQLGKFAGKNITAWTASINTSYEFSSVKLKPEIGLKTELISGDQNKEDNKLQTFNPLYPRGAYFGLAALIGPANLIDVHPSISFELSEKVSFDIDDDFFWRYTHNDGLYAANMSLIYPDGNTTETKIGNQLTAGLIYTPNGFLYFRGEFTWFKAGNYLKAVGAGKDILFTGITAQIKF